MSGRPVCLMWHLHSVVAVCYICADLILYLLMLLFSAGRLPFFFPTLSRFSRHGSLDFSIKDTQQVIHSFDHPYTYLNTLFWHRFNKHPRKRTQLVQESILPWLRSNKSITLSSLSAPSNQKKANKLRNLLASRKAKSRRNKDLTDTSHYDDLIHVLLEW